MDYINQILHENIRDILLENKNSKNITLVENILHNILRDLINEGRNAEKAKQNTYNVIKNYFKNASWLNDVFNDQAANPNRLSVLEHIENTFRTDFFGTNVSDSVIRLEPIMMNVALGLGFEQNEADGEKLNRLKSIIQYIKLNNGKEGFPIQLNKLTIDNTSYDGLNKLFGEILDREIARDNETANQYDSNSKMNPNYEVIEIHNIKEAHEYGQYGCSRSTLCFTYNNGMWEKFTDEGLNRVYLILNKNWKNIPEEYGENNPYDEYGLSMIFLFINPDGNIAYSNTRWNHGTREHVSNVDNSFTKSDISKLLGVNFNSIFKPYSDDELMQKGFVPIHTLREILANGNNITDMFKLVKQISNELLLAMDNNKYVLYNTHTKQIPEWIDEWLDEVGNFNHGIAKVSIVDKLSFIDESGNLILDNNLQFDDVEIEYGFNIVYLNDKENVVCKKGLVSDEWFDEVYVTSEGFAYVDLNDKYSIINSNLELIGNGKLWFDKLEEFVDKLAVAILNEHILVVNIDIGKIITNISMIPSDTIKNNDYADLTKDDNNYIIHIGDFYTLADENGNLIGNGKLWFNSIELFNKSFYKIKLNNQYFLIDKNFNFYDINTKQPIRIPLENESIDRIGRILRECIDNYLNRKY